MKKKKMDDYLAEGRQVVFLITPDRKKRELSELGEGYELTPVAGFDTSSVPWPELRQFGLFELKRKMKEPDGLAP